MKKDVASENLDVQWIIPGVLALSKRPGHPEITVPPQVVERWVADVLRQRIVSVINLMSDDEIEVYYRRLPQPLSEYYADAGLVIRHVGRDDLQGPVSKQVLMERIRSTFATLPTPVLLHCSAGEERAREAAEMLRQDWAGAHKQPVPKKQQRKR